MMGGSGCQVDVVITGTGTHHNLQLLRRIKHLTVHLVRTDNHGVGILHGIQQLCLLRIFLQQHDFVACSLQFGLDTIDSGCCKWFFCCYQYFHKWANISD